MIAPRPTLFILEDNQTALRTLRRLLESSCTVQSASNPEDALRLLATRRDWCGFLLDVGLGDDHYGGIRVLRGVRHWWPLIPAALVTGTLEPPVINEAAALGATMLAKPPGPKDLKLFLERAGDSARVGARAEAIAKEACGRFGLTPVERQLLWWAACGNTVTTFRSGSAAAGGSPRVGAMAVDAAVVSLLEKTGAPTMEALVIHLRCESATRNCA